MLLEQAWPVPAQDELLGHVATAEWPGATFRALQPIRKTGRGRVSGQVCDWGVTEPPLTSSIDAIPFCCSQIAMKGGYSVEAVAFRGLCEMKNQLSVLRMDVSH